MERQILKKFHSADGKRSAELVMRDDGLFCFVEHCEDIEDMRHLGADSGILTYWRPSYFSGIYQTLDSAEKDMRNILPWMREDSN
jgi:hypothetical protein